MRSLLVFIAVASLAAEPSAKLSTPVLGYVFDSASKSVRAIAGVPGAASLEGALPTSSKLEIGFVSPNRRFLVAATLDGVIVSDLGSGIAAELSGAPADIALGAWSADSNSIGLWSRTGSLQVWGGFEGTPALRFEASIESANGIAIPNLGNSAVVWNESGLYLVDGAGSQQLVNEAVFGAALRNGSSDWAAVTASQLLRSNAEPAALNVSKAAAVAFTSNGILVGGEKAVGIIDESGSRVVPCECDATALERLAGHDVFRLTGLDAPGLAIFDGDSGEARILYIPTEGGRR